MPKGEYLRFHVFHLTVPLKAMITRILAKAGGSGDELAAQRRPGRVKEVACLA